MECVEAPHIWAYKGHSIIQTSQRAAATWLVFRQHHIELSSWLLRKNMHWNAEGFCQVRSLLLAAFESCNGSSAPRSGLGQRLELTQGILEGSWEATNAIRDLS